MCVCTHRPCDQKYHGTHPVVAIQGLPSRGGAAGGIILWLAMVMMSCDLWHHCALHALTPSRVSELLVS